MDRDANAQYSHFEKVQASQYFSEIRLFAKPRFG